MSCVMLIAADKSLPVFHCQQSRIKAVHSGGTVISADLAAGFSIGEHVYYRAAVDELELPIKPFQYELNLEETQSDLRNLMTYLEANLSPGDCVELWRLWLSGDIGQRCPPRFQGRLADFDMDTLHQFLSMEQICLSITI